jgi:8-oxo-dGTP diphosphatase
MQNEVAEGGSFGVAVKAAIVNGSRLLVLYKTAAEALGDPDPAVRVDLPGGRVGFGESPVEALRREVAEETGLDVEVVGPVSTWHYVRGRFQLVGVDFLCDYVSGHVVLSEEHERYAWLAELEMERLHPERKSEFAAAYRSARARGGTRSAPSTVGAER